MKLKMNKEAMQNVINQRFGISNEKFRGKGSFGGRGTSQGREARRSLVILYKW